MIVAPHPDDEVFGAGGLITAKRAQGAAVSVVYLTGGGASHRTCCGAAAQEVTARRRELAVQTTSLLGVHALDCSFLSLRDGALPAEKEPSFQSAVSAVGEVLTRMQPAEIYCTHSGDVWPDHVAASAIVRAAARESSPRASVFEYAVWAPLNRSAMELLSLPWRQAFRLNVAPWAGLKAQAIRSYLSGCAPCGHPWVGQLPGDFLKFFEWPCEVFFAACPQK